MRYFLQNIKQCTVCEPHLALGANPIVSASKNAKIVIIGQAPGIKVHTSGIAWNDASGNQLRKWLNVSDDDFYNTDNFAIIPMGFCYPGKSKNGDLPPRKECAPLWHQQLFNKMSNVQLVILIGGYAQRYYLKEKAKKTLTETVHNYSVYLPSYFVLPHPSPRNRFWLTKNSWFEQDIIPDLQKRVLKILIQNGEV
ncbi:uracil-DNA glycosylase family protein [Tenacibaculum sp. UWU-22]|uniref:uracil-DNA glycosylase family protein n=1 Tax=Tenacibaculum sp. UWU-22 TaxID=3234187 RepID=UPI0034DAF526